MKRNRKKSIILINVLRKKHCMDREDILEFVNRSISSYPVDSIAELQDEEIFELADLLYGFDRMFPVFQMTGLSKLVTRTYKELKMSKQKKESEILSAENIPVEELLSKLQKEINSEQKKGSDAILSVPKDFEGRLDKDQVVPFHIPQLDSALGIGGLKTGKMAVIYGPEGSGKTTLALYAVKSWQEQNKPVVYFDSENALASSWMKTMKIDKNKMLKSETSNLNEMAHMLTSINEKVRDALFVIDSIPAFLAQEAHDREDFSKDVRIGAEAKLWKELLYSISSVLNINNNTLLCISQERANLNRTNKYEPETKIAGGSVIHYATTTRIKASRMAKNKEENKMTGNREVTDLTIRLEIEKNKSFKQGIHVSIPAKNNSMLDRGVCLDQMISNMDDEINFFFLRKKKLEEEGESFANTNKLSKIVVCMIDGAREAIQIDEPEFSYDKTWLAFDEDEQGAFSVWLNDHPAYMDWVEEKYTPIAYGV